MGSVSLNRAERRKLLNKSTQTKVDPQINWEKEERVLVRTENRIASQEIDNLNKITTGMIQQCAT